VHDPGGDAFAPSKFGGCNGLVSAVREVPVIEGELVATIRELASRGMGSKTIARTVGGARNTVRRYLRQPIAPGVQVRPAARRLTDTARDEGGQTRATPSIPQDKSVRFC
jgi:hypothetical protein